MNVKGNCTLMDGEGFRLEAVIKFEAEKRESDLGTDYTAQSVESFILVINDTHRIELSSMLHPGDKEFILNNVTYEP